MPRALAPSVCFLAALLAGCAADRDAGAPRVDSRPPEPGGRALVAIADGDLVESAFADGLLFGAGESAATRQQRDTLTRIALPLPDPGRPGGTTQVEASQVDVLNAVLGMPRSFAVNRAGTIALVLSTRGRASLDTETLADLPPGGTLTAVDLTGPAGVPARIIAAIDLGRGVETVAFHPAGDIAIVLRNTTAGPDAAVVSVGGDSLVAVGSFPLAGLPTGLGVAASSLAFNPAGDALGVTSLGADTVSFFRFSREGGGVAVEKWGEDVPVENYPAVGEWTPDGRHFVVTCCRWGDAATRHIIGAGAGALTVVRVASPGGADHRAVSTVTTAVGPEGLAISPDGRFAVTGNVRQCFLDENDPRFTRGGSLSLVSLDPDSGDAYTLGEFVCGSAPQGLAFDTSGEYLFATDFEGGAVQLWRLDTSGSPTLAFTGLRVGVQRGVHAIAVLP